MMMALSAQVRKLIKTAGFDSDYVSFINNKQYQPSEEVYDVPESESRCFDIVNPDSTSITDHIYEGFCIEKLGSRAVVRISGYVN